MIRAVVIITKIVIIVLIILLISVLIIIIAIYPRSGYTGRALPSQERRWSYRDRRRSRADLHKHVNHGLTVLKTWLISGEWSQWIMVDDSGEWSRAEWWIMLNQHFGSLTFRETPYESTVEIMVPWNRKATRISRGRINNYLDWKWIIVPKYLQERINPKKNRFAKWMVVAFIGGHIVQDIPWEPSYAFFEHPPWIEVTNNIFSKIHRVGYS